jgi:hypothetical protein
VMVQLTNCSRVSVSGGHQSGDWAGAKLDRPAGGTHDANSWAMTAQVVRALRNAYPCQMFNNRSVGQ